MGDIYVQRRQWADVYALSGISTGSGLLLQNKSPLPVVVIESEEEPSADSEAGFELLYSKVVEVSQGSPGVWVKPLSADARIFVQGV